MTDSDKEKLSLYIDRVREFATASLPQAEIVQGISEAANELLADGVAVDGPWRTCPEDGYGRNLLYRDPEHGFVVIAMVWPPGYEGQPHDHNTWGVVCVAEGSVRVDVFDRADDGSDPGRIELEEVECIEGGVGQVSQVLPPHKDFHTVSNASSDCYSVSIHTYGRDIKKCRGVDPATGKMEIITTRYTCEETI